MVSKTKLTTFAHLDDGSGTRLQLVIPNTLLEKFVIIFYLLPLTILLSTESYQMAHHCQPLGAYYKAQVPSNRWSCSLKQSKCSVTVTRKPTKSAPSQKTLVSTISANAFTCDLEFATFKRFCVFALNFKMRYKYT